ncbi:MAG: hypothetical protein Q9227_007867 [Pyrenula ochraceoflavens]
MAPQLAWIGLGNMGRGMVKNLVQKGNLSNPLIIHNRTKSKADSLSQSLGNSTVSSSIEDAVSKSDIIFICLGDDGTVQSAVETAIASGNVKGKLFVDCSTIHPDTTSMLTKALEGQGAHFVAAPVFGAPAMAEGGQLVIVLAGPPDQIDRIKPYCTGVMGRAIIDMSGKPPSTASQLKVIGNTFILSMVTTLSEGHVAAEKSGLGTDPLHQFIELVFPGPYTAYSNRLRSGDYYKREEPLFAVDLARKDARHAQDLAGKAGTSFEIGKLADGYLEGVQKHMGSRGDIAGIYGAKREASGLKFEV